MPRSHVFCHWHPSCHLCKWWGLGVAWGWKVKMIAQRDIGFIYMDTDPKWTKLLSGVRLFAASWIIQSMEFPQARVLEWVALPFFRGSSQPRDWTQVSRIVGRFFSIWATGEAPRWPLAHKGQTLRGTPDHPSWGKRWGSKWDVSGWMTWLACQGPWQRKTRSPCLACSATTKPFEKSVRHPRLGSSMSGGLTEEKENLGDCRTCPLTVRGTDTCHSSAIHTTLGPAPRSLPAKLSSLNLV